MVYIFRSHSISPEHTGTHPTTHHDKIIQKAASSSSSHSGNVPPSRKSPTKNRGRRKAASLPASRLPLLTLAVAAALGAALHLPAEQTSSTQQTSLTLQTSPTQQTSPAQQPLPTQTQANDLTQDPTPALTPIRSLVNHHQFPAAERDLRAYLSLHPDSAPAHFLLGYVLFSQQKPTESLAEYTAGARYAHPAPEDLMAVAADYVLLKDNEDADKWFSQVTTLEPRNALAWYYLGRTRFYEGRYDDSARIFLACLQLNPRDIRAETNLGLAYNELGRQADAIAAYQQAIQWASQAGDKDAQP
jgi:tetratricopeptide (TPR) repeat protein